MNNPFVKDAKVRFTQQRLAVLTPRDRRGLAGRIGEIQATEGSSARKATVYFPADGPRQDLRLFRVDCSHLEVVEGPPPATQQQPPGQGAKPASPGPSHAEANAPADDGNLSQDDLDKLFD